MQIGLKLAEKQFQVNQVNYYLLILQNDMIKIGGEMTPKLQKSIQVFEKAVSEFKLLSPNAKILLEVVS